MTGRSLLRQGSSGLTLYGPRSAGDKAVNAA
jgi:hypothetical protein